ncbi:MAG: histidinol-phosphate transaminase [Proteobacteria bacterium]|nr:histidinol-phosphate transaminase [Pseudomonadota bacterium]
MSLALRLARPEIAALAPYAHAHWDPALERLHANENPWRYVGDQSLAGLNRYPEPQPRAVEARLAALYGVAPERLIAGRGSDEGIDLLSRAFLTPYRDAALVCPPTFGMYALATRLQGAALVEVPLARARGYALDEAALHAALTPAVKLVYVCTPNNPTGNAIEAAAIERLAARLAEQALLVVDEAYAEFSAAPSLAPLIDRLPNLVVLRTLSKAYALAGARVGAVIADTPVVELLRRVIPPYSMPTPTSEAVLAALEPAPLARARARIAELCAERARLAAALATLPLVRHVWPSEANFLLVECSDAAAALARARRAGFLLRDFSAQPLTAGALRITVGTPEQNDRLLEGLATP